MAILTSTTAGVLAAPGPIWDNVPVKYDTDVIVLGGGPSGVGAAIAAARSGAKVLLIEQYSFLGGMGTAAEVNVFMNWAYTGGIFQEVLQRLSALNARNTSVYDIPTMQMILDDMVGEAGVKVLYYTRGIGVTTAAGKPHNGQPTRHVTGLVIQNKSGVQIARAKTYIDCSGDADLAAFAGAPFEIGRPEDGKPMPMTMIFRVGGCTWEGGDLGKYHPDLKQYWASTGFGPNPGEVTFNATRILNHLGTDGESLSEATILGRREVLKMFRLLKEYVPGFEHSYLLALPTQIGVRESRRVMGATVLTGEQVLAGMQRGDVIARCKYDVDIHNPTGAGAQIIRLKQPYDIPFRCLIPRGVDNLLIAGRPISADHVAESSLRIQPTCFALGQAAGTAAAICSRAGIGPWDMEPQVQNLQAALIKQGADLGADAARRVGLYDEWRRRQLEYRRNNAAVPEGGFTDLPVGHPAREAAIELAKLGVFSGNPDGSFDADGIADTCQVVQVLWRALRATELEPRRDLIDVAMPAKLKGLWWVDSLQDLAERRIITEPELATFDTRTITEATLRTWVERAYPNSAGKLSDLPPELRQPDQVTRGGVAFLLWEAVKGAE